jgi:hypothetical protein
MATLGCVPVCSLEVCLRACVSVPQGCAVVLAMGLGLRSIASVDGFVNADSGELIVRDVKPSPALTDGSPLLQQVGSSAYTDGCMQWMQSKLQQTVCTYVCRAA